MSRFRISLAVALISLAATSVQAKPGFLERTSPDPAFLPVDQAFEIQPLELSKEGQLRLSWRIAPGYFLYRPRIRVQVLVPDTLQLESLLLPAGRVHEDELFGRVEIYGPPALQVALPVKGKLPHSLTLKVSYQGCAEAGLCYPPQERLLEWGAKP
jgi:thiol:disulfide interchange protein DsbD